MSIILRDKIKFNCSVKKMVIGAKITGIGMHIPEKLVTNAEIEKILNRPGTAEWLEKNVGIKNRYIMAENEATSDLAVKASLKAMEKAGIRAKDIDLIILSTDTPDYLSPATSTIIQYKLGAKQAGTFDINSACAGFVTTLVTGYKYIQTEEDINTVLIIGAYGMSKFVNWKDHYTATLFADGAGALILQKDTNHKGLLANKMIADGQYYDYLGIYSGGTKNPNNPNANKPSDQFVTFQKRFPSELNAETWPKLISDVLNKANLKPDDINYYFFTQLNLRTIEEVMETLKQPMEKTHVIMDKWGYTGSACIPMAMYDAIELGLIPKLGEGNGEKILLCSSGGGYNMSACIFTWW